MYSLGAKRRFPCSDWMPSPPRGAAGFDLLRDDRASKDAGKRIANRLLEFALNALNQPFLATHLSALASLFWCIVGARQTTRLYVVSINHGIGTV